MTLDDNNAGGGGGDDNREKDLLWGLGKTGPIESIDEWHIVYSQSVAIANYFIEQTKLKISSGEELPEKSLVGGLQLLRNLLPDMSDETFGAMVFLSYIIASPGQDNRLDQLYLNIARLKDYIIERESDRTRVLN